MQKLATIPLILLLLQGVSYGIEIELSKKVLKLGEALEVKVKGIEKAGNYICWLNDNPYPLYQFNASTLRTFIGFGAKFKAKTCSLRIEETDGTFLPKYEKSNREKNSIYVKRLADALRTETPVQLWTEGFTWPTRGRISGRFGERRFDQNNTYLGIHQGIDITGKTGTPVFCPNNGRVVLIGRFDLEGKVLVIDHGQGFVSTYFHLSEILVEDGEEVRKDQVIARVGATGRVTASHLHFGLYIHGTPIDPLYWLPKDIGTKVN
jgi:murein DD-endopeptidase MepM/ murein hydrolase activator NlpD